MTALSVAGPCTRGGAPVRTPLVRAPCARCGGWASMARFDVVLRCLGDCSGRAALGLTIICYPLA